MQLKKIDILVVLASFVFLTAVSLIAYWLFGNHAIIVTAILSTVLVLLVVFETYRRAGRVHDEQAALFYRVIRESDHNYRQTEALFSIFSVLKPATPLPDTRGWAASPDFLKKLMELILREQPEFILEASSGVSTLVCAYCLKQIGAGRVLSLEHDRKYAKITEDLISSHGLGDYAKVIHAPLTETEINGKKWLWYDLSLLEIEVPIDLLVIDGPPEKTQSLARFPALPLLYKNLSDNSTIIMDDGNRRDETKIVELWQEEFHDIDCEFLEFEKGAFLLRRSK